MNDLSATPPWVRDAVFYQIFPDRFASSARVPKPGPLEPWDAPPTFNGFKGGDLLGVTLVVVLNAGDEAARLTVSDGRLSDGRFEALDLPGWMSAKIDRMQSGALSIEVPGRTGSVIRVVRSAS